MPNPDPQASPPEDTSTPPAVGESVPPTEEVQARRSKRTFWQRLGGEGLTISLIIHVILILIAAIWVISTVTDSVKKDPDSFSTGQGGGAAGDKAKQFKTRAQPKNPKSMAKNTARITSKSANATISLPDLPTSSVATLNTGMMGGGSSKGFGGGSGGIGPDLSGVGARTAPADILTSIIDPSAVVSDQYSTSVIGRVDGGKTIGRILSEEGDKLQLAVNPFDFWEGANFALKIRNVEGYRNYDKSTFMSASPLHKSDAKLEEIYNQEHSLQDFLKPENFKSYDELKRKLNTVLGLDSPAAPARRPAAVGEGQIDVEIPWLEPKEQKVAAPKPQMEMASTAEDDDDDVSFFKKLASK